MIDEKKLIEDIDRLPIQVEKSKAVGHNRPFIDTADIIECVNSQPKVGVWIPVSEELPKNDEELVLVQVSGRPKRNITLENALELATYSSTDGWILETYPEWENANVVVWQALPEPYREEK